MTIIIYGLAAVNPGTMHADPERLKYLFKEVLGVDVDAIVRQVAASLAVERARQVRENSAEWARYMEEKGGLVFLPKNVTDLGKRPKSEI